MKGYHFLYFGNDWFAENRTSSHHVAQHLAQRLPLLYVDCPGLRAPAFSGRDLRRLARKLKEALRGPRQVGNQMWHCTLLSAPASKRRLRAASRPLAAWLIRRWIRQLGWRDLISWFVVPHPGFLACQLGEDYVVYYCTDNYAALPGVDSIAVRKMDEDLSRRADIIFAVSPELVKAKRNLNDNVVYAPHGVDIELFARAMDPATHEPPLAAKLRHPVIGFFGVLGAWLDYELLRFLAVSRPQWTFLFVGRIAADVSGLAQLPNVVFAGPQPYQSLPQWAKAFDVGILPYHRNEQVMNANPLKLREYLAAGRPVVAVSTPEIDRFAQWVHIAHSHQEFLEQIERALATDTPEARMARRAAVRHMSWEARVTETLAHVEKGLRKKLGHAE